ncbi:MAG TPA: lysylphosphatidylglycerol synthase transmembrane domain-containing protein [Solirubrobacteraceae bacterium]|nr:lysylphosphatidylglycerol synthase transmembrane domain-containing protein [Solirubrobacteraceae bacterium]
MSETRPSHAREDEQLLQEPEYEALEIEAAEEGDDHGLEINRRTVLSLGAFLLLSLAALYFLLPQLAGLEDTWRRIEDGSPYWMLVALLFGCGMFFSYVAMFRGIFLAAGSSRIDWRASYQITMAGLAASRIFAAGGAGGLVLTAWALRRSGMRKRVVADKTLTFLILTYMPYMAALIVCGLGLRLGIFHGPAPFGLTVVPAIIAVILTAIGVSTALVPTDLQRRLEGFARGHGKLGKWAQRLANLPASASAGMRDALQHLRHPDPALAGAVLFWAFQVAILWASFHAFGGAPPLAVLTQAFFVGMFGNLLPMPGGVGGVEGGMIASLAAFEVDAGQAVVAVLLFRAVTFWLPLIPGVIAYFQLRKTVDRWRDELHSLYKVK